jgi:hypothetical protein
MTAVAAGSPVVGQIARVGPPEGYLPIAEHSIVGDMHSAALVGVGGTIDCYFPERFDEPSVFGALLPRTPGGTTGLLPWTRSLRRSSEWASFMLGKRC